jgi:hypothetical protein
MKENNTMRTLTRQGALGLTAGALAIAGIAVPAHAAGGSSATDRAGSVVAWGSNSQASSVPDLGDSVVAVAAAHGDNYDLAINADGTVTGWGASTTPAGSVPTDLTDVTQVSATAGYAVALKSDGSVVSWGVGKPTTQPNLPDVTQVLAAPLAAVAVTGGTVTEWGSTATYVPVPAGLSGVVQVASETQSLLALKEDGTIVTWGMMGSPGDAVPASLASIQGHVTAIAASGSTSAALLDDGTVAAWSAGAPISAPNSLTGKTVDLLDVNGSIVVHTTDGQVVDWNGDASTQTVPAALTGAPVAQVVSGYTAHDLAVVTTLRFTAAPAITGTPAVGQTLHLTPATFNLAPSSVTTQWKLSNGTVVGTATTLTVTAAMAGKTITATQTATLGDKSVTTTSAAVGPIPTPSTGGGTPAIVKTNATISKPKLTPKKLTLAKLKKAKATVTVTTTGHTPTGTVTIKLKNKTVTAKLANGKATLKLKKLAKAAKKGKNKLTITYTGDTTTKPTTTHTTLKLK